jgi:hypothetical protein
MSEKIFVSIVSFMDPLLEQTIQNMLGTAKNPENIVFGIVNQDVQENLDIFEDKYNTDNFRIISILPEQSFGCCWARSQAQTLIADEKYYMQSDSHHNYVKHWDFLCIHMLSQCKKLSDHSKVILSTYGTPATFSPCFTITHDDAPYYMKCEKFYDIPKVRYVPTKVNEVKSQEPILWHTISAHFIFTYMQWVEDIPYDPELYFDGEEDTLALRSYTHGYDIYYPYTKISYHYYTRDGEKRHCNVNENWHQLNTKSIERLNDIIKGKLKGKYGLGKERTMDEYTEFSMVDYANKCILVSEHLVFGDTKFIKTGQTWKDDENVYKELESIDEFYLLYDINNKRYAKLNKYKCTLSISKDLVSWELIGPANENKVILSFGEKQFTQDVNTKQWIETSTRDPYVWNFDHIESSELYYIIHDTFRNMTLRLHKNLSCYEAMWPPENKYVILYGTPKITMVVEPNSLTPKPKQPLSIKIGYSIFSKEDSENVQWKEYCVHKEMSFNLKELLSNDDFYILIDNERKLLYRLHKDLSKLEIQTHEKIWTLLYVNGETTKFPVENIPTSEIATETATETNVEIIPENKSKTHYRSYNSTVTIVCVGSSDICYFDAMKKNHLKYAKYFKYNYYYYDTDEPPAQYLSKHSKNTNYILSMSTKCIFTKLDPVIKLGKNSRVNAIVSSIDNKTVCKHMIFYKTSIHGTSTYFEHFEKQVLLNKIDSTIHVVDNNMLATSFQNHNKKCFSLCFHVLDDDEICKQLEIWNKVLKIM